MPLGALRTTAGLPAGIFTSWQATHAAWAAHFDNVQRCTLGVDAPELYSERTFVGFWAAALYAAFPSTAAAFVERPVPKTGNSSGGGLLDLWMSIDSVPPVFDYSVEAKPFHVHALKAQAAAARIFQLAKQELLACRTVAGGRFSGFHAGLTVGVVGTKATLPPPSAQQLHAFEDDLWVELERLVIAENNPLLHGVLASKAFSPGGFNAWKGYNPHGAYAFFLCEDSQ